MTAEYVSTQARYYDFGNRRRVASLPPIIMSQSSAPPLHRVFKITREIDDDVARECIARLLFWRMEDPKAPRDD